MYGSGFYTADPPDTRFGNTKVNIAVKLKKPFVHDGLTDEPIFDQLGLKASLKADGHDGFILKNVGGSPGKDWVIAWDSSSVKVIEQEKGGLFGIFKAIDGWEPSPDAKDFRGCNTCILLLETGGCRAYPTGMPIAIASGEVDHMQVRPGQVGNFIYESVPSASKILTNGEYFRRLNDLPDESQTNKAMSNGIMIALYPTPDIAEQIAIAQGSLVENPESPDELHITLLYMGRVDEVDFMTVEAADATLRQIVAITPPIEASISGTARFTGSDAEGDPFVYLINSQRLMDFREELAESLAGLYSDKFAYTPHMTLAYLPKDDEITVQLDPMNLSFDEVILKIGDEKRRFPFAKTKRK